MEFQQLLIQQGIPQNNRFYIASQSRRHHQNGSW
ncbi:hypothetical protein M8C21_007548 [Ambrosia artemisiifolia]|uniref:Uncharacterized protein n=1 Tax=Ambrosia artemisiifolia TaxID=4212 RepID=A0AAD5CB38_AMBAR|nr:hypothetical protein M8C21_007548 [Ambrosia artemisiifolia]